MIEIRNKKGEKTSFEIRFSDGEWMLRDNETGKVMREVDSRDKRYMCFSDDYRDADGKMPGFQAFYYVPVEYVGGSPLADEGIFIDKIVELNRD